MESNFDIKEENNLRIGYISSEPFPHAKTNTQQIIKNIQSLRAAGLRVDLIIPRQSGFYFNSDKDLERVIGKHYNVDSDLGLIQLGFIPANTLQFEKFTHPISFLFTPGLKRKYDIFYTRNPLTAFFLILFQFPFIFETYRRIGDEKPGLMTWLAKMGYKERFFGMVVHSRLAAESLKKVGFPSEKILILHNGIDNSDMLPILTKEQAREKLGLKKNAKYVVYTGNMQKNKCIESVIDVAEHLPEVQFMLVGGKPKDIERLESYCLHKKLLNVKVIERQPIKVVSNYLYAADALIIPPSAAPLEKFGKTVLPFKLFAYLAAGRPVIAPNLDDTREILVNRSNALLVKPDNPSQNAEVLKALLKDETLQNQLAHKALETSKSLTWENRAIKFKNWLKEILS
jgi:glycosyltransferase involved in cell wall biosynthesis